MTGYADDRAIYERAKRQVVETILGGARFVTAGVIDHGQLAVVPRVELDQRIEAPVFDVGGRARGPKDKDGRIPEHLGGQRLADRTRAGDGDGGWPLFPLFLSAGGHLGRQHGQ